ncbi:MAG: ATP-dependent sacrificial sulfur transferase LarE [Eubacterium sp.]|nr:ATP-dependent sacrificial sulfur transferase LarE [Eubacterium sp.]
MTDAKLEFKLRKLKSYIKELGSVAVAFSAGVDSTFLLKVAHEVLGDKVVAVTANTSSFTEQELQEATLFCQKYGIVHVICEIDNLSLPEFANNAVDRCYHCKKMIFNEVKTYAITHGFNAVVEGANKDDEADFRPGHRAIEELKIESPLRMASLTKEEIRTLARTMGLEVWKKPSCACLASRFVYGESITRKKLKMVECAEQYLSEIGCTQYRVRMHGMMARIEIMPEDFSLLLQEDTRIQLIADMHKLGFQYVSLDLMGFRTGSMNEALLIK